MFRFIVVAIDVSHAIEPLMAQYWPGTSVHKVRVRKTNKHKGEKCAKNTISCVLQTDCLPINGISEDPNGMPRCKSGAW